MLAAIPAVLDLNHELFAKLCRDPTVIANRQLVSQLILTSVRLSCRKFLDSNPFLDISRTTLAFQERLQLFYRVSFDFDASIGPSFVSLLRSILLLRFPNVLHDFQCDIDTLGDLDPRIYDSFVFCGLGVHLRILIVDEIRKECLSTVASFKDNFEESALSAGLDKLSILIASFRQRFPDIAKEKQGLKIDIRKCVVTTRANEIFDIVTGFPESKPALLDLKKSCSQTLSHQEVSETTVRVFVSRLLHLGASTSDIVAQYINAIQALNIVDESGGLTRAVSPPIQQYLTTRSDLLDTIVTRILEDDSLVATAISAQKPNDDDVLRDVEVQKEMDLAWAPEPLHSHIRDLQSLIRDASDSDALALLLNVYGSLASFVTQLEKEIARRVETSPGFSFDNEVRAVELLKRRFGSQSFLNCEVILRDVADSKRLAVNAESGFVQPLVVSELYWPPLSTDFLRLPEEVEHEIERYTEEFERFKHPRKLKWFPTAGSAQLELIFDDGQTMKMSVSPIAASVALLVNTTEGLTVDIVCEQLEISRQAAEAAILFWTQNNVFIRDGDTFRLSPTKPALTAGAQEAVEDGGDEQEVEEEEEIDPHVKDASVYGNFVKSILQNRQREQVTLKKLYDLMQKFIMYPKFTRSYDQYLKIVKVYVDDGLITVEDDVVHMN
jgi:anaphase-promoting complex subunit 2